MGIESQHGRGCILSERKAALSTEFGMNLFLKKAGDRADTILAELGTYTKGKNVGKTRGFIHWIKVVEGGFDYSIKRRGVLRGGCIEFRVTKHWDVDHEKCEYDLDEKSIKQQFKEVNESLEKEIEDKKEYLNAVIRQRQTAIDRNDKFLVESSDDAIEILNRQIKQLEDTKRTTS